MTTKDFEVAIVGGGIGGLAAAIGLHRAGVPVKLFESAHKFGEIGAGISLGPNSQNALKALGLFDEISKYAYMPKRNLWFQWRLGANGDQRLLSETVCKEYGGASIHRAQLLDSLVKQLPDGLVSFGKRVERVDQPSHANGKVTLHFKDGTSYQTDIVIGYDGIHSQVRGALDRATAGPSAQSGSDGVQWSGTWAYRGLIPTEKFKEAVGGDLGKYYAEESQMFLGKDKHILLFPIEDGSIVNIVAFTTDRSPWPQRPNLLPGEPWTKETSQEDLLNDFAGWDENILNMLKCIERPTKWALHQLIPPLGSYTNGRVIVGGDAAHGGTPHQGAMAGQAIEDALFYSRLFGHPNVNASNVLRAMGSIDAIRVPRANEVLQKSLDAGDVYEFAGPLGDDIDKLAKDLVTRFDYLWDYSFDDEHRKLNEWLKDHGI
ncbi:hypothetical protein ACQY0O_002236 [Thecaphora frezii]